MRGGRDAGGRPGPRWAEGARGAGGGGGAGGYLYFLKSWSDSRKPLFSSMLMPASASSASSMGSGASPSSRRGGGCSEPAMTMRRQQDAAGSPPLPTHLFIYLCILPARRPFPGGSVLPRRARREQPGAPGARGGANTVPAAGPRSHRPPARAAATRQPPRARKPSKSSGARLAPQRAGAEGAAHARQRAARAAGEGQGDVTAAGRLLWWRRSGGRWCGFTPPQSPRPSSARGRRPPSHRGRHGEPGRQAGADARFGGNLCAELAWFVPLQVFSTRCVFPPPAASPRRAGGRSTGGWGAALPPGGVPTALGFLTAGMRGWGPQPGLGCEVTKSSFGNAAFPFQGSDFFVFC